MTSKLKDCRPVNSTAYSLKESVLNTSNDGDNIVLVHLVCLFSIGSMVLVVCSMRCLRGAFTDASWHFVALAFTLLIFRFDFQGKYREPILVNLYVMLLATNKLYELLLKVLLRFSIKIAKYVLMTNKIS